MERIKAVIVDDEPAAITAIKALLLQLAPEIMVSGIAQDGLEAIRIITNVKPDLVFLDVNMPVLNGIQIMEKLGAVDFQVIFTTGSAAYALAALKLKAADYLLKPIDPAEFIIALDRAREQLKLRQQRPETPFTENTLQLPSQNEIFFLNESDISYITGMGSYCQVHTINGEKITVSRNIGQLEQKLSERLFFRSHNSYIINLTQVVKYVHKDGYFVEMKNGALIEVSRRSKDGLLKALSDRISPPAKRT